MPTQEAERLFLDGLALLQEGNSLAALALFEKAVSLGRLPVYRSYCAYCIAKERGQIQLAEEICRETISDEPLNPLLYLNLGRVLVMGDRKREAIEAFRQGLQYGDNGEIVGELNRLGTRGRPVLPFLPRKHPLNRYLGILLRRRI